MGKLRIGAAKHHWFANSLDVWGHGVNLGTVDRSDEPGNILVPGKLAEGEHTSRIGRLVIFDDELNWSAEHATCLVYLLDSELGSLNVVKALLGLRSGDRGYHADFERLRAAPKTGEHDHNSG